MLSSLKDNKVKVKVRIVGENMSVSKRLFQYAMKVKGTIFAAMLMLFIFVIAELAGPFVAKTMIDDHIVGIENLGMKQNRVKMLFRIMGFLK